MKIIIRNKIGEKIEKYRKETGATKTWIAEQLGVSRQRLNSILKIENPTIETFIAVSFVLKCNILELFEYEVVN